ncbi:hypothetical protein M0R72_16555 [Candidatus Pacearchaeota archaeon]|jgi:hypothetical protein|nr:hypothetical protein [Candidatus Pacearchaeota archaeon]
MKLFIAIMATALMVSVASAANQYAEASAKLEEVISSSLGLAPFSPSVIMTNGQTHITLDSTQLGDYPTPADVRRIIELYYKIVAGTGYAGSLVLVINNLDGIATYRWLISPYSKDDFDTQPNYVMENLQKLNPGLEGIAGSGAWIYSDPNYVGRKPA